MLDNGQKIFKKPMRRNILIILSTPDYGESMITGFCLPNYNRSVVFVEEGINTHPVSEHEKVSKEDGQRVTHEQIIKAFFRRWSEELGLGHDGEGANMRAEELGVMIVVMVMRGSPDAAGTEGEDTEDSH